MEITIIKGNIFGFCYQSRHLIVNAKKQQIKLEIEGSLPDKTRVSEYDLCTILTNLIKNAIEACEKMDEISKRNKRIAIGTYKNQIFISVKNPFTEEIIKKENHLITIKKDSNNHRFGSRNVENILKKYNGVLGYQYSVG